MTIIKWFSVTLLISGLMALGGCGKEHTSTPSAAPTPAPAPLSPTLTIAEFTASNFGTERTCLANGTIDNQIDELTFAFQNPAALDLSGWAVRRANTTTQIGRVGACTAD